MEIWWEGKEKLLSYQAWQRLILFFEPSEHDPSPSPLHVAAKSSCPPGLFPLLIQVYCDQLRAKDTKGRNALQIACSDPVSNRTTDLRTKIHYLLREDAGAALELDREGRTAFFIALEAGVAWNEGLEQLFDFTPHDITTADSLTRLPPFLLAAVGAAHRLKVTHARKRREMIMNCSEKSLATIFKLLTANPSCIELMKQ